MAVADLFVGLWEHKQRGAATASCPTDAAAANGPELNSPHLTHHRTLDTLSTTGVCLMETRAVNQQTTAGVAAYRTRRGCQLVAIISTLTRVINILNFQPDNITEITNYI